MSEDWTDYSRTPRGRWAEPLPGGLWVWTGCSSTGWALGDPGRSWSAAPRFRRQRSRGRRGRTSAPSRRTRCGTVRSPWEAWAGTRTQTWTLRETMIRVCMLISESRTHTHTHTKTYMMCAQRVTQSQKKRQREKSFCQPAKRFRWGTPPEPPLPVPLQHQRPITFTTNTTRAKDMKSQNSEWSIDPYPPSSPRGPSVRGTSRVRSSGIYSRSLRRSFGCSSETWLACWRPLFKSGLLWAPMLAPVRGRHQ